MSMIARSRLRSALSRRFSSEAAANNHRESIVSSSTVLNNPPPPPSSTTPPTNSSPAGTDSKSWNFLKFSLIAALTGGVSLTGYATYAYTLDEVEEKTKALRESTKCTVKNDASSLDKIQASVYSGAMTVPAKLVELYIDLRKLSEEHVKGFTEPIAEKLLPDLHPLEQHVFTLVLDLTETLIYSDWKRERGWKTFKRPGLDAFLEQLSQYYEIVVYSDQLQMYVDPVIDGLDPEHKYIRYRLSRGATKYQNGKHYRDLSKLNRDPAKILYLSADALGCSLQPENGVPITSWKLEADDTALLDLIPFLEYVATHRPADIRPVLASYQGRDIAKEFIERTKEYQRRMEGKQGRLWRR